jgi:hypothetical protein
MRYVFLLASTTLLAACGGGGGSVASAPVPAPSGGSTTPSGTPHTFVKPILEKEYVGLGATQVLEYETRVTPQERGDPLAGGQQKTTYSANSTTPRNSSISVNYDPTSATFSVRVPDSLSAAAANTRFQDPASRTDYGGAVEPQWGTPRLTNQNIQYLQAGDGDPRSPYKVSGSGTVYIGDNETAPDGIAPSAYTATSFFFLKPGLETKYVTYAGYARNAMTFSETVDQGNSAVIYHTVKNHLERGAFAYGETTRNDKVPTTGSGTYRGSLLASMVYNPTLDGPYSDILPNYFQWIEGSAQLDVNFATALFQVQLNGTVLAPQVDNYSGPDDSFIKAGARFSAVGKGDINLVSYGGFKGGFDSASFLNPDNVRHAINIAGSSVDGSFFGPAGEEAGASFRIVGGNPDERIDIVGAFVGAK